MPGSRTGMKAMGIPRLVLHRANSACRKATHTKESDGFPTISFLINGLRTPKKVMDYFLSNVTGDASFAGLALQACGNPTNDRLETDLCQVERSRVRHARFSRPES